MFFTCLDVKHKTQVKTLLDEFRARYASSEMKECIGVMKFSTKCGLLPLKEEWKNFVESIKILVFFCVNLSSSQLKTVVWLQYDSCVPLVWHASCGLSPSYGCVCVSFSHAECPAAETTEMFIRLCEHFIEKTPTELIGKNSQLVSDSFAWFVVV